MKIDFSILIQVLPILMVLSILYIGYVRYKETSELRILGVKWLQALQILISNIQKHRGLTTAILAGDRRFEEQLLEVEHQVSRQFEHIASLGRWVNRHTEWAGITQHWAKLAGNVGMLSPATSFDQHCRLIKNISVFIDELTEYHQLNSIYNQNINAWREYLILSEYIGQARALGTWVAIEKSSSTTFASEAANKKLIDLNQKILDVLDTPESKRVLDADMLEVILEYLIYIDKDVLMGCPSISSTDFFQKSTDTLHSLFERMDEKLFEVHQFLKYKM